MCSNCQSHPHHGCWGSYVVHDNVHQWSVLLLHLLLYPVCQEKKENDGDRRNVYLEERDVSGRQVLTGVKRGELDIKGPSQN